LEACPPPCECEPCVPFFATPLALRSNGGGTPRNPPFVPVSPSAFFDFPFPSRVIEFIDEKAPDKAVFSASRCSSDNTGSLFPFPDSSDDCVS